MSLRIDTHEVTELAVDFESGPSRVQRGAVRILERSSLRVHRGMRRDASGHKFLSGLARTVGRDRVGDLEYEVGFDKRGQGNLANIITGGSINNAPVFSHTACLRRDEPLLERDFADSVEGWVLSSDA